MKFELTENDVEALLNLRWSNTADSVVLDSGYRFQKVDHIEFTEEYRWAYLNMLVLMHPATGRFYGFQYEVPSTELQDMQDDWSYIEPELVEVERVPTYTYKVV